LGCRILNTPRARFTPFTAASAAASNPHLTSGALPNSRIFCNLRRGDVDWADVILPAATTQNASFHCMEPASPLPPNSHDATAINPDNSAESRTQLMGQIFFGRYHIRRELGEGGMGKVVLAEDLELGVSVAVKMLRDRPAVGTAATGRLKEE